jgi:hypothetical protein
MNYQLFLYNSPFVLDADEDNDLVLSRAVNNIGDVQSRDSDMARDFNGAMIAPNKLILENAQVLNSGTVIPYRRIPARIEKNGNIISVGYCLLLKAGSVFRMSYYGGNADWFKLIGDKSIQALSLSDYNHLWTATNVRDARLNNTDWEDVYCYPNVDYGAWQTSPTAYWTDFYTGVFQKYIIWKIFKEAGFTISGEFWDNNSDLAKGFIPFCGSFKRDRIYDNRNAGEWDDPSSIFDGTFYQVYLQNTVSSTHYNINNGSSGNNIITILDRCHLKFRIKVSFTNADSVPEGFGFGYKYYDQAGNQQTVILSNQGTNIIGVGATYTDEWIEEIDCDQTEINIQWLALFNLGISVTLCEFEILEYIVDESEDDYLYITETFNYVTMSSILPDFKQKDILVHFFNQFCLMCDTDHQINYVKVFGFNTVTGNIPNAKDWSNKLDRSVEPERSYVFNNYAQSNKFLYKHDEQNQYLEENPEYGSGVIEIDNENLEVEKVVFQSQFASIIRQSSSLAFSVNMAFIPKFQDGDEVNCAPYIGFIEFETENLVTMDGYGLEGTQPCMRPALFSYLLEIYYPAFIAIIAYAKILDCLMHLDSVDVSQLDFRYPIRLDSENAYFYLNLVDRYKITGEESTQVQLVRL